MTSADRLDSAGVDHLLGFHLALATAQTRRIYMRHVGTPFGLRAVEFTLLMLLRVNGAASPKQLSRALGLPAPNVTALVDKLAARGLVERRRSSTDGRALRVLLTPEGTGLAERAHAQSLAMEAGLLQCLSAGECALLRELLVKVAAGASA
jgi:DNA-binding MarR family transcriptional regulator